MNEITEGARPMLRLRFDPAARMEAGAFGAVLYHLDLMFREATDGNLALGVSRVAEGSIIIELDAVLTAGATLMSAVNAAASFREFSELLLDTFRWLQGSYKGHASKRQKQLGFYLYHALPAGGHVEISTVAHDKMALKITAAALQVAFTEFADAADDTGPEPLGFRVPPGAGEAKGDPKAIENAADGEA